MKKIISILLFGLLGFLGCSGSDAGTETSPVTVQAFVFADEDDVSALAFVMDQEENLLSEAMLTINDEPMNIGFLAAEDLKMDQEENLLSDAIDQTVKGVPSGDYQPFYFLDFLDLSEGDTVNFVAKGWHGSTLYSSTAVVPEKITLIEPQPDATFPPGEAVDIVWEGGEPSTLFQVVYAGGDGAVRYSSDVPQGQTAWTIPGSYIEEGEIFIFVIGWHGLADPASPTTIIMATMGYWSTQLNRSTLANRNPDPPCSCSARCRAGRGTCFGSCNDRYPNPYLDARKRCWSGCIMSWGMCNRRCPPCG